ncbi:MAG: hypothetical protein WC677_00750 [Clostridia bacterium]|jgi:hypothetical protein
MEDKTIELLEKMYNEISGLKAEFGGLQEVFRDYKFETSVKFDDLNHKVDSNTMLLENMHDKVKILAEIQQNHFEINERQHIEMNEVNKEQINLLKNALQNLSRDTQTNN